MLQPSATPFPLVRLGVSVVGLLLACATLVHGQTYVAGQTYFGTNRYIEYRAGDLPVIITAPHGGSQSPASIPDRVPTPGQDVVTQNDANTTDLARRIVDVIEARSGHRAHLVICDLARIKLDVNRDVVTAAQGNAAATLAWNEYHGFITAASNAAQAAYGFSFQIDQHGHGHANQRLELGYNASNTTLAQSDTVLNLPRYQWNSYLRTLPLFRHETSFAELLRGTRSFGEFFTARNYPATPSPRDPAPNDPDFFDGGYTTDTHTCLTDNSTGHGLQIEANMTGVRDTAANRQAFATAVAEALNQFLFDSYGYVLGTGPVFRLAASASDARIGGAAINVTVLRDGYRGADETMAIAYRGTATRGGDYAAPVSVSFAAGQASAGLALTPAATAAFLGERSVEIALVPSSLQSAATAPLVVPLGDGRTSIVRVDAPRTRVSESAGPAVFRLRRTDSAAPLTVNLVWGGDAVVRRDYLLPAEFARSATFAVGQSEVAVTVPLVNDAIARPSRRLTLGIGSRTGYVAGGAEAAIAIEEDDIRPGCALWLSGAIDTGAFRDDSGRGRHAVGLPAQRGPSVVAFPTGGNAIAFNGADQALQLPRFILDPSGAFTVAFRFRCTPGATVANQNLLAYGPRGSAGSLHVYLSTASTLRTSLRDAAGGLADTDLDVTGAWADGAWRHYVLVVDADGGRRVYIDGTLARSAPGWRGPLSRTEQLWLGWRPQNAAGGHFNGGLADLAVYERTFNATEIKGLAATFVPPFDDPEVTPAVASRIANLSIRTGAGSGDSTLIVGFYVNGPAASGASLLVRGIGPTLSDFGVSGTLTDPEIEVVRGASRVAINDNWGGGANLTSAFASVGAFALSAAGSRDAALLLPSIEPGGYSVIVRGADGGTGVALAEIYDAGARGSGNLPRLINVSARTRVGTGDDILIAGFVVDGDSAKRILVRAIGPTLAAFGVTGALTNPALTLFRERTSFAANDNWGGGAELADAFRSVGAFALPADSLDAALLLTLPPGAYSAQVSGAGSATGIALVEVYEVASEAPSR